MNRLDLWAGLAWHALHTDPKVKLIREEKVRMAWEIAKKLESQRPPETDLSGLEAAEALGDQACELVESIVLNRFPVGRSVRLAERIMNDAV